MNKNYVLVKPLSTEQTSAMTEKHNRYVFEVHPDANKIEIKAVVEELFGVVVVDVKTVRIRPRKRTRQGRVVGMTRGLKKAYVKVADGQKIAFFEGE